MDWPRTSETRRSRSRPSTPPRSTYFSLPIGLLPVPANQRIHLRRLTCFKLHFQFDGAALSRYVIAMVLANQADSNRIIRIGGEIVAR